MQDTEYIIKASQIVRLRRITRPASAKRKDRAEWTEAFDALQDRPTTTMPGFTPVDKRAILRLVELGFKLGKAQTYREWLACDCELWEAFDAFGITADDFPSGAME